MKHFRTTSIARKLTLLVILFSSLVTLVITALQLYLDYRHDVGGIHTFLTSIGKTHLKSMEESVWIIDDLQINLQLEGLIQRQDIVYAAVSMENKVAWSRGTIKAEDVISYSYPLYHKGLEEQELVGTLQVAGSLEGIYHRLLRRVAIILLSNGIKTFFVAGFILLLFQHVVTRHLVSISDHMQRLRIDTPALPLKLDRSNGQKIDELDQVTTKINSMHSRGHRAYLTLHDQEQRLRIFFDSSEEGIFSVDASGVCTFMNRICQDLFWPPPHGESFIGSNLMHLISTRCRLDWQTCSFYSLICRSLESGVAEMADSEQMCKGDGTCFPVCVRSYPVFEHGECTGVIVFFRDITEQYQLEREKQLLANVVSQSPAIIAISDNRGRVEYVNPGFEKLLGYAADEVIGRYPYFFWKDLRTPHQFRQMISVLGTGEQWRGRFTNTSKSGDVFSIDAAVSPVYDNEKSVINYVLVANDITRELELQDQLYHAQKMEAIGKLAASLAHEFGNPLLGVRFAIRDIKKRVSLNREDKNLMDLAEMECDRMKALITDLRQINRPSSKEKSRFNLHDMLDSLLIFNRKFLESRKIKLIKKYDSYDIMITAVEDQLRQVFVNLIINAGDAMAKSGGVLMIATELQDDTVVVSVCDNGYGIKADDLDHIFEPFFTTKKEVEGTGLGLPVSYGIVRAHEGEIKVGASPGETIFAVSLPLEPKEGASSQG